MTTKLMKKRMQRFEDWQKALGGRKPQAINPYHDTDRFVQPKGVNEPSRVRDALDRELDVELAAWEQASDDDFEAFENSLG